MNCLGNEVSKNVILAGVEHMTILDPSTMTAEDTKTHFLPRNDSVGENVWYFSYDLGIESYSTSRLQNMACA